MLLGENHTLTPPYLHISRPIQPAQNVTICQGFLDHKSDVSVSHHPQAFRAFSARCLTGTAPPSCSSTSHRVRAQHGAIARDVKPEADIRRAVLSAADATRMEFAITCQTSWSVGKAGYDALCFS
jgi:hypothetical protein